MKRPRPLSRGRRRFCRTTVGAGAALACVLVLLLAGCHRQAADVTVITFWAMGREGEVVAQLLPDFERAHPRVRVDLQQLPWTAAHEKLLTAFAGNALPDICQLGNTWIPEFAALNALEPLQPLVDASPTLRRDDFFPGIWDTNVIDATLYGIPWYVDTRILFYRKDLLAHAGIHAPPRTWDEWKQAMAAIKAQAGPDTYAILLPLSTFEELLNLAIQQPDPLLRDDGTRGNFESPGFRRAFAFYVEMFQRGWAPKMSETQISNVWDEFAAGFFSFYITGPWNIGEFRRRLPARLQDAWATAPLPGIDGPGAAIAGGTSLVLMRGSPHKREAWQLIEYLSAPEQQQRFHALTGDLPSRLSAWNTPALTGDVHAQAFRDQLDRVKATPKVPEWERIATEVRLTSERVIRGGEPVDRALRDLDARTDAILEKRRWMLAKRKTP